MRATTIKDLYREVKEVKKFYFKSRTCISAIVVYFIFFSRCYFDIYLLEFIIIFDICISS